jgi:hypothetical protein
MKRSILSLSFAAFTVAAAAVPAWAQGSEGTAPPPAASSYSGASGGGAGIGVGGVVWLGGSAVGSLTGAQLVYDQAVWHIEGVLGFENVSPGGGAPSRTTFGIGAAGWYHLARGASADFSLGGGFGFVNVSPGGGANSTQQFFVEPGAEVRVFLTPNVSLSARVGLALSFGDGATDINFAGQTTGTFGFTYFFR